MPSGMGQSVRITFLSDPSGLTDKIRPSAKSRKNRRPVAVLVLVVGFVFKVSVALIVSYSFQSFRRSTFQNLLSCVRFWLRNGVEVRLPFLNESSERFLGFGRSHSLREFLKLELHRAF